MLKVQNNSRQIPDIELYTADKKYNDLIYGYLQEKSQLDSAKNVRYIGKEDVNFTDISHRINLTRQSISKKFKNLIAMGLIEEDEANRRYILRLLDKTESMLVPFETLRKINNTLSQNSISIYVLLLKKFIQNKEKPYTITLTQIKKFIGIATSTSSNNEVVTDILQILQLIGLIKYKKIMTQDNKTPFQIESVTNVI